MNETKKSNIILSSLIDIMKFTQRRKLISNIPSPAHSLPISYFCLFLVSDIVFPIILRRSFDTDISALHRHAAELVEGASTGT